MVNRLHLSLVGDRLYLGGYGNYLPADQDALITQIESFRYILVAVYAFFLWEHIVTFPIEISRWKQLLVKRQVVLVNFCVLISRYISWSNAISSAVFFFAVPFSCQATFTWIFVSYALIWALTATIFVVRVQGLYPGRRNLHRFVWAMFTVVSILWIISLGFFYSARLPKALWQKRVPQCTAAPSPYIHVLGFGGSMLFDVLILCLTVYSATNNFASRRSRHGVLSAQVWVLETAIVYAFVCFTCNAATFFVWIFQKNVILRAYTLPFAIVINPIVASRIVFHGATWGSKTALLESRLVKITEDDVANWQRDPGVMGAEPVSSRRPSHTTFMLPSKGNRFFRPTGNQMDKEAYGVQDESLGFDGILITQAGNMSRKVEKGNGTPDSVDESDLEKGPTEITFRRPFANIMAPQRAAAHRSASGVARTTSDPFGRMSPNSKKVRKTRDEIEEDEIPMERVSPTSSTSPAVNKGTVTGSASDVVTPPFRRGSDANSIASITGNDYETVENTVEAPQGWTIQEMLRDDALATTHDSSFRSQYVTGSSPTNSNDTAMNRGSSNNTTGEQSNDHITISQHITTRID